MPVCDNCHKEAKRLDDGKAADGSVEQLCPKCKRMPRCDLCHKRCNRVIMQVGNTDMFCGPCNRRTGG